MPQIRVNPFKTLVDSINAGGPLPEVNVTDFKALWTDTRNSPKGTFTGYDFLRSKVSPGANIEALILRCTTLRMLLENGDLAPWQHGDELDDELRSLSG